LVEEQANQLAVLYCLQTKRSSMEDGVKRTSKRE
jgi:hypothetical protein